MKKSCRKMFFTNFEIEGLPAIFQIPDRSVGEIIYQNLLSNTNRHPLLVDGHTGVSFTSKELLEQTCSLGGALRNYGCGPGTVIGISSENNLEFFIPVIATFYIGATIAPISHFYQLAELDHILNISKPEILFCSRQLVEKYKEKSKKMSFIRKIIVMEKGSTVEADSMEDFIRSNTTWPVSRILTTPVDARDNVALFLCSSGTTGFPKCVMLTHRNINTIYNHFRDPRIHEQNPTTLLVLPFFHGYGFFVTLAGILTNSTTIFLRNFIADAFLKAIQDYKVTRLFLAPSMVVTLAKTHLMKQYNLSSIQEVFCGAAPLKKSTEEEFKRRLNLKGFRQGYGLSETTFAVTLCDNQFGDFKPGSAGKILPYLKLAVRDLKTGAFLGPNQQGEICIKGDSVMKGYYNNLEATRNTLVDNWLITGDIGYYDEEGHVFITERLKELIKYKGFQVAPAELEAFLLTHPDIIDSAVVGRPDEKAGELPLAFIVKRKDSIVSVTDVENFMQSKLSPQKWLRGGIYFLDAIPKLPNGKIARKDLKLMINEKSKL